MPYVLLASLNLFSFSQHFYCISLIIHKPLKEKCTLIGRGILLAMQLGVYITGLDLQESAHCSMH